MEGNYCGIILRRFPGISLEGLRKATRNLRIADLGAEN
jgi:hypothetical protein